MHPCLPKRAFLFTEIRISIYQNAYSYLPKSAHCYLPITIVVFEKAQLFKNPQFLICTAFVFYYCCRTFAELANACNVPLDNQFYTHLWLGLASVNCLANLTYGIAILCIQEKQEFTMHF